MKMILLPAVLIIGINVCLSQIVEDWVRTYTGPGNGADQVTAMASDIWGNVYVTGWVFVSSPFDYAYATVKYDANGVEQWAHTYSGPGNSRDEAYAIAVSESGDVYVTGKSIGDGTSYDFATIKYSSDGEELWVQRYNGPANGVDEAYAIALDGQGNVFVTGRSTGAGNNPDYATIKYNSDGSEEWVQRYRADGGGGEGLDIGIDNDGHIYVTGYTASGYGTVKYDNDGEFQWEQLYNGPGVGVNAPSSMAVDYEGNVYVTGASVDTESGFDYATVKYDTDGNEQWVQRYNGTGNGSDEPVAIAVDHTGNVYVTGKSFGNGTGIDYATVRYNADGDEEWIRRYSSEGNLFDGPEAIALDNAGNIYVTGRTGGGLSRIATIKYAPDGAEEWIEIFSGGLSTQATAIVVNDAGNVFVAGGGYFDSDMEFVTIKYSESTTFVKDEPWQGPGRIELWQNYPNPFNPITTIRYSIPESGFVSLKIYDVLGKEVAVLVSEEKNPGIYEVNFDAYEVSSGIYIYRLTAGDHVQAKRLVLLK